MTVHTITRQRATRDDLTAQGLWDFYDVLESAGYNVGIVDSDPMDRHLLVTTEEGHAFKLTGYGKDRITVVLFQSELDYEEGNADRARADLKEKLVLHVLAKPYVMPRAA